MPSRIDEAGHTKAFDYPVAEHWGESQRAKRSFRAVVFWKQVLWGLLSEIQDFMKNPNLNVHNEY